MLIDELEITEDLTEEKETELRKFFKKCTREDDVKWVSIECINNDDSLLDTLVIMKDIIEILANTNDNLSVITATITGSIEGNKIPEKIKIKLFDEKPKVVENIIK